MCHLHLGGIGLKCKWKCKSSFPPKKNVFFKFPYFQTNFLWTVLKNVETKFTHHFLRVFMTKCTSWILVFLVFKLRQHRSTVLDKIWNLLLSRCYHVSSNEIPHITKFFFVCFSFVMGIALSLLKLLRENKPVFIRVSSKIIKLGKIWEFQLLILTCPAFRGQEFKGKIALW